MFMCSFSELLFRFIKKTTIQQFSDVSNTKKSDNTWKSYTVKQTLNQKLIFQENER